MGVLTAPRMDPSRCRWVPCVLCCDVFDSHSARALVVGVGGCALQFIGVEHNGRRLELLVMPGMMPGELRTLIQSTFKVGGVVALKGPGDQVRVYGS